MGIGNQCWIDRNRRYPVTRSASRGNLRQSVGGLVGFLIRQSGCFPVDATGPGSPETAVGGNNATSRVGSVRSRSARTSSPWSRRSLNTSARSACRQASGSAVTYGVAATCSDRSTARSRAARRLASASSTDRDKPTIVAGGRRTSTGTEGWSPTASTRARRSRTVRSSSFVDPSAWSGGGTGDVESQGDHQSSVLGHCR